jgi:hypothetical protein
LVRLSISNDRPVDQIVRIIIFSEDIPAVNTVAAKGIARNTTPPSMIRNTTDQGSRPNPKLNSPVRIRMPAIRRKKIPEIAAAREAELLSNCYRNSLQLAAAHKIRSVAFPSISTGVYSYPVEPAARIAISTVKGFIREHPGELDLVEWVLFDANTYAAYERVLGN